MTLKIIGYALLITIVIAGLGFVATVRTISKHLSLD